MVLHIQTETLAFHPIAQAIDVFHHQVPVALRGVIIRVLQRFHKQRLIDIGSVAGKLAHLIGHTAIGIGIGHGHNLIGIDAHIEAHVAQSLINAVFSTTEQPRILQLFVINTAHQTRTIEHRRSLIDVACRSIGSAHGRIFGVGLIGRNRHARHRPKRRAQQSHRLSQIG